MTLTLYNTLTRRKEPFQPIDPGNVRMYVCGPTVYDLAHIGNARPIIVFDVLFRLLRHIYGEKHVTYARNITDVDDKINARAVERYPDFDPIVAIRRLTEETTAQFHKDIAALGVLEPTVEPRATGHIGEMVALCEMLVARGHAYIAEDHVLFDVSSMPDYGRLANRSLNEMEAGARVDVAPYKRGSMDFVLWKPSKPGEPAWPSPLGIATPGRPGWHIECSAMAEKHLGQVFDIHGGGIDLVFPHHENEIAQSRCAHGTSVMANVWMHNGFLQVEGEKMSKSLGNFVTIRELLEGWHGQPWPGQAVRLAMLGTHYRQPIDWTLDRLVEARSELDFWQSVVTNSSDLIDEFVGDNRGATPTVEFLEALSDDLNTPSAISVLRSAASATGKSAATKHRELARNLAYWGFLSERSLYPHSPMSGVNVPKSIASKAYSTLNDYKVYVSNNSSYGIHLSSEILSNLGLLLQDHGWQSVSITSRSATDEVTVGQLISARLSARKAKDWKESDRIRDELAAMGIQLKDVKDPATGEIKTEWEVKR